MADAQPAKDSGARELHRDLRAERDLRRLRLAGSLVVGVCAAALAVGGGGSLRWLVVALGAVFSLGWLAASRRRPNDSDRLRWDHEGIELHLKGTQRRWTWDAIKAIEPDEERLVVRVCADDEARIPLGWHGVGLHELAEELRAAHAESKEKSTKG